MLRPEALAYSGHLLTLLGPTLSPLILSMLSAQQERHTGKPLAFNPIQPNPRTQANPQD
jgi:hypothetical protein